jgi:hypothetical protein
MHAMHLFSAAKAEADLRGELARHMQVHDKLAREWAELEQWRSGFKAAVQRTAREPMPRCTRRRQGLLARLDSYPRRSCAFSPSRTGCVRRRSRRKRAAGSSER